MNDRTFSQNLRIRGKGHHYHHHHHRDHKLHHYHHHHCHSHHHKIYHYHQINGVNKWNKVKVTKTDIQSYEIRYLRKLVRCIKLGKTYQDQKKKKPDKAEQRLYSNAKFLRVTANVSYREEQFKAFHLRIISLSLLILHTRSRPHSVSDYNNSLWGQHVNEYMCVYICSASFEIWDLCPISNKNWFCRTGILFVSRCGLAVRR